MKGSDSDQDYKTHTEGQMHRSDELNSIEGLSQKGMGQNDMFYTFNFAKKDLNFIHMMSHTLLYVQFTLTNKLV